MWGFQVAIMLAMVALNGVLAAFEIALASISLSRLQSLELSGRRGSRAALSMKRNMEGSLAVVQLGITLVGSIAGATAGVGAEEQLAPVFAELFQVSDTLAGVIAVLLLVLPLTAFMIVFGELIPKVFALRNPELVVLGLSPPMKWFSYGVWPLVWALEGFVHKLLRLIEAWRRPAKGPGDTSESFELQDLRSSAAIARTSRLIGSRQEKIILGAADLSRRPVREIMLPAEFISLLTVDSSVGDALIAAHLDMHTRFPAAERAGDPQSIVGYVMFKDIVAHLRFSPQESSIRNIVRGISRYPAQMSISQVLERLIRDRAHIALVLEDDQRVAGMVTMEDMIEELVGELEDEYDRLPAQVVRTGRGWIVGGGITLSALHRQTGVQLPLLGINEGVRNLNDWMTAQIDGPVRGAEVIETPVAKLLIRKTRRHKVMEAYLSPKQSPSEMVEKAPSVPLSAPPAQQE